MKTLMKTLIKKPTMARMVTRRTNDAMKERSSRAHLAGRVLAGVVAAMIATACSKAESKPAGVAPQVMADALQAVLSADRTVYTQRVVNRLQDEEGLIKATERWNDEKTLPLPAQMFRMGSELVTERGANFRYSLLSLWPINNQNGPKTDVEKAGLKFVAENGGRENFYSEEVLGNRRYFTAVYADLATSPACVTCHNEHQDSPRVDFKLNDVMGGVVIRIPLP
jgi:hypothetical protein